MIYIGILPRLLERFKNIEFNQWIDNKRVLFKKMVKEIEGSLEVYKKRK